MDQPIPAGELGPPILELGLLAVLLALAAFLPVVRAAHRGRLWCALAAFALVAVAAALAARSTQA